MEIAAKITFLIRNNHIATSRQLCKQYNPITVKQALIRYGMSNQENLVCHLVMEDKSTFEVTTGYFLMKELVNIVNTNQFQITSMIPFAAFDSSYSVSEVIASFQNKLIQKNGQIIPRKLRTRNNKKQTKEVLVKKPSQTATNVTQKNKNNKTNNQPAKNQDIKGKTEKTEKKNLKETKIETKPQRTKVQQMKNQVVKQPKKENKKPLKVESSSEDEQKILKKFQIDATVEQNKNLEPVIEDNKMDEEVPKPQVVSTQEKQEDLELDFEDAFEALLKNKKSKPENKVQNKNMNLPDKLEKKTTQKTSKTHNMPVKPTQQQPQSSTQKISGQGTLFGFLKKK